MLLVESLCVVCFMSVICDSAVVACFRVPMLVSSSFARCVSLVACLLICCVRSVLF